MIAVLGVLFTSSLTALFGWTVTESVRSGRFRGIGWSLSRGENPVFFWLNVVLSTIAGIVSLAFSLLLVWLVLR